MNAPRARMPGFGLVAASLLLGALVLSLQRMSQPLNVKSCEPAAAPNPGALPDARIDLNREDVPHLSLLPAIGPKLAQRVAASREADGPFRSVEDLHRVPGIGPKTIASLQKFAVAADAE